MMSVKHTHTSCSGHSHFLTLPFSSPHCQTVSVPVSVHPSDVCASNTLLFLSAATLPLQPQELTDVLEISNMVFTSLFSLEMLLKLLALGLFGYIKNPYNGFDSIIVIIRWAAAAALSPQITNRMLPQACWYCQIILKKKMRSVCCSQSEVLENQVKKSSIVRRPCSSHHLSPPSLSIVTEKREFFHPIQFFSSRSPLFYNRLML